MYYLDSISIHGWGKLLLAFIPSNFGVFITDVLFCFILPFVLLFLLVRYHRNNFHIKNVGAWRRIGRILTQSLGIMVIFVIGIYFLYHSILKTSISGIESFEAKYRKQLLNAPLSPRHHTNIKNIAMKLRNNSARRTSGQYSKRFCFFISWNSSE